MNPEMMGTLGTWGPIVLLVAIFYFLLYRPQKNEQKRRKSMLDNLKKGDRVITIGGIYGTVSSIDEKSLKLLIAKDVEIEMVRSSINSVVPVDVK
ncbi:preprotein translocase subunit YajC [Mitsuokella sp. oral taxon 131]|uniref:preprotein translocase subunit YajC n=1 Tax=Mitsuokella sp. oral taxon 131 TaxID=1321780 RepID=UPI0003AE3070|nr:preprotein translocase subunit YajC [Mitsuokella sp. oral taxon 131]ERL05232.1 preprotein translocase, YajC subunit [Mitsuokella sp. oral taxon 131 str. W9106]